VVGALADQVGGLLDDAAAVIGGLALPHLEGGLRGVERIVEVGLGGVGQMRERLLRRRIEHVLAATAIAVVPLAVDVKPELRIHGCPRVVSLRCVRVGWRMCRWPNE
jgi:hypothetical protein